MADGSNVITLRAPPALLRVVEASPAGTYDFAKREPDPEFEVDRKRGEIVWRANGLRIVHRPQITALADLFAENGWMRHFNALLDAELKLSEPEPPTAA